MSATRRVEWDASPPKQRTYYNYKRSSSRLFGDCPIPNWDTVFGGGRGLELGHTIHCPVHGSHTHLSYHDEPTGHLIWSGV